MRAHWIIGAAGLFVLGSVGAACGACDEETTEGGEAAGGEGAAGEGAAGKASGDAREELRRMRTHLDLGAIAHLADVDRDGTWIDFGTPARFKHTAGRWQNDWGRDRDDGDGTYTELGAIGNLWWMVDEPGDVTARVRLRSFGPPQLVVYINGETLRTLDVNQTTRVYEIPIPAAQLRRGENQLRFRATATVDGGGRQVSAAIYDVHFARAGAGDGAPLPPLAEMVHDQDLGGTSRHAIVVRPGTRLAFHAEVPPGGKLALAVGATGEGATASVKVTPATGDPATLHEGPVGASWGDHVLDLAPFVGGVVRIELATTGGGNDAQIAWADPQIVVPNAPREQAEAPEPARNVIVLTIDTLRASKLRAFNPRSRVQTPVLDAVAQEGTVFERGQAPENWTKPSVASILTSLSPMTHNTKADASSLSAEALTMSEVFQAADFETAAFLANGYVSDRFGFGQGWDHYRNYIRENRPSEAGPVFRDASAWVEEHKDERFFMYIQTIDPHVVYDPPEEFLRMYDAEPERYAGQVQPRRTADLLEQAKRNPPAVTFNEADQQRLRDLHDGEISYHDRELGHFLDKLRELGLYENMIFVVTSDHGEEFADHGSWGHGHSVFQELLHVPLIVRWPAAGASGERIPHTVSTMDIAPTVLSATGVAIPEVFEGRSLLGFMRGNEPPGPWVAFSEFLDDRRVIRAGRWKLIQRHNQSWTMFDLERDPGEQHDLEMGDERRIALRYLRTLLGQYLGADDRRDWIHSGGTGRGRVLPQADSQIDAELCRNLRDLGYVDSRCDDLL